MSVALDAASPAVLLIASEWVMDKWLIHLLPIGQPWSCMLIFSTFEKYLFVQTSVKEFTSS